MSSGVEYSAKGLQSVCPVGVPTFDELIGGGLALTSINLIEDDWPHSYSNLLAKSFISSGITLKQRIFIFSSSIKNQRSRFIRELPSISETSQYDPIESESMKIAFQYENLPKRFDQEIRSSKMDFGEHLSPETVDKASIVFHTPNEIFDVLKQLVIDEKSQNNSMNQKQYNRIYIDQFGSPIDCFEIDQLPSVLHRIKVLLRNLDRSVCLISLSSLMQFNDPYLLQKSVSIRNRLYFESDFACRCSAFDDETQNLYKNEYDGLLQLIRLPSLNSFGPYNPKLDTLEFGFKMINGKRFLHFEKLSLPPEIDDQPNRFVSNCSAIKI
ncbi:DEAD/DEAH RNA helicase [Sarcoptes scabiei]|nr:DEAD/DEAH RNA helicase [Sarcoptes scabiei]